MEFDEIFTGHGQSVINHRNLNFTVLGYSKRTYNHESL